jgi:hypothetical protein
MNTDPLTQENRDKELTSINETMKNNEYQQLPTNIQHKSKTKTPHKQHKTHNNKNNKR